MSVGRLPSDTILRNLLHSPGLLSKLGNTRKEGIAFLLLEETSVKMFMKLEAIKRGRNDSIVASSLFVS